MRRLAVLVLLFALPTVVRAQPAPVAALPIVQQWSAFQYPQEDAFTLDVPRGWQVNGGTFWWNALQFRNWVLVTAPDGNTVIAINDPREGSYVVPSQMLAMAGFHAGSLYSGGGGTIYTVARYLTGSQFAAIWGERRLAGFCEGVTLRGSQELPQLTEQVNVIAQAYGISHDAGEATFSCMRNNMPMRADVLVSVAAIGGQAGAIWYAEWIEGFVAPAPLAGVAAGTLMHILQSIRVDPQWVMRTPQTNLDVSRIAARTNAAISDVIMQSWADRGAVMDRIMDAGSRARLGIDIYSDPATGTRYTVANTYQYYWANPAGMVVGTNTDTAPKGFSRLDRVPP